MNYWDERREEGKAAGDKTRCDADVDYARVVHSASFRRLQGKTQILNLGDSDFYRTRLTHSLEVAQVAGGITKQLRSSNNHPAERHLPDLPRIQAIGFTHDLGHPPFGHGGEKALNYCMRKHGGFEGNGQTLRILSKLEKFSKLHGSNLTRRTLLGALKYPVAFDKLNNRSLFPSLQKNPTTIRIIDRDKSKPPKCYMKSEKDVVKWLLKPLCDNDRENFVSFRTVDEKHGVAKHKSFDCSIMDLADDISYGVHDLEDGLALKLINKDDFQKYVTKKICSPYLDWLKKNYGDHFRKKVYSCFCDMLFGDSRNRKYAIGRLIDFFIKNCYIETLNEFSEPMIRYRVYMNEDAQNLLNELKEVVREKMIESPAVQHLEFKGQQMVVAVFEAMESEPKSFLPEDTYSIYKESSDKMRVICDHISGMTDAFLIKTYDRLFSPRMGSVFDKI